MSQLRLTNQSADWKMNVLAFNSPVYSEITSAQTKKMSMFFPVRSNQPEIQFKVIFSSENEFENFQRFVRAHQVQVASDPTNLLTLNWPQRSINNWTGVIKSFVAGGQRFNFAPTASFSVDLVDSFVSTRAALYVAPGGILWQTIYGAGMGQNAILDAPVIDESTLNPTTSTAGQQVSPNQSPSVNPAQPGIGPGGIGAGS